MHQHPKLLVCGLSRRCMKPALLRLNGFGRMVATSWRCWLEPRTDTILRLLVSTTHLNPHTNCAFLSIRVDARTRFVM